MAVFTVEQAQKVNLAEALIEAAQEQGRQVAEPPLEQLLSWSEAEIRRYVERSGSEPERKPSYTDPSTEVHQRWFPGLKLSRTECSQPRWRVLCFANAGSAEDMYTSEGTGTRKAPSPLLGWCIANAGECLAVQLPGRNLRRNEPFLGSPQEVAQALLPVVASSIASVPYVVIAHSVGTWCAYEFLMLARSQGLPMPEHLFLSAMAAPDMAEELRPWKQQQGLDEAAFQEECRGWDVSEVLFTPAMWSTYKDLMRADFMLFDSYHWQHHGHPMLDVPITAFYGSQDRRISKEMVQGWAAHTSASFSPVCIQGHHLWPTQKEAKATWLQHIVDVCGTLQSHVR